MKSNEEKLKDRFIQAIKSGEFSTQTPEGTIVTLKDFKQHFSEIKTQYVTSFLPAATLEPGMVTISHVLKTGTIVTQTELHDYYDTTGCSMKGSVIMNTSSAEFSFEYGVIIYFNNGTQPGCAELCCKDNFEYCTWDIFGLK